MIIWTSWRGWDRFLNRIQAVVFFISLLFMASITGAQTASPPVDSSPVQAAPASLPLPPEGVITVESIEARRNEFISQLDLAKKNQETINENTPQEIRDGLNKIVDSLNNSNTVLNLQLGVLKQLESNKNTESQLREQLRQLQANGIPEKPPYSFILLDNLRNQISSELEKKSALDDAIKTAQDALNQTQQNVRDRENTRLLAKEALDNNRDETAIPLLTIRYQVAQISVQISHEYHTLRKLEFNNQKAAKAAFDVQLELLREREKLYEKDTVFQEKDLKEPYDRLDADKTTLTNDLKKAQDNLTLAQKSLDSAQDRLAKSPDQNPLLIEDEKARRYERDYYTDEVSILPKRLARIESRRTIWQRRFSLFNMKASINNLHTWVEEGNKRIAYLDMDKGLYTTSLVTIRRDLSSVAEKMEQSKEDKQVIAKLQLQQEWLQKRINLLEDNIARIDSLRRFHEKLINEINQETQKWSLLEVMQYVVLKIDKFLDTAVWSSKTEVEEKEFILTVGKLAIAFIYLFVGLFIARFLSRHGIRFVFSRLGVHEGATAALESLGYYFILILVFILTFRAINISLTAFAFLGGALAIGIGFGSQNILNNFISGIILLIERPIRVGDVIEVDGVGGKVIEIGARCTRVQTFSNVDLMIPNSKFLENKVVNQTLDDTVIRTIVSVGVAYGSDLRKVFQMIKKAVDDHGLINKHPDPVVTLADFGDNAILFEVRFWITSSKVNRLVIESDVRHRIYSLFTDVGIVMAYPQRDVHLDTQKPLEIRMLSPEIPSPSETKSLP